MLLGDSKMISVQELEKGLKQFYGSFHYYPYTNGLKLTDGVKWIAEQASAFWLLDIVASAKHKVNDSFAVAEFEKFGTKGFFKLHDGREPQTVYHMQYVPLTDFPLSKIDIWLENTVLLLPSEH